MIWHSEDASSFSQTFYELVVTSMRSFQTDLNGQLPLWEKEWRTHDLPKKVRVGIATGVVFALRRPHKESTPSAPTDFVGYCINLAVRLQDHCPELGFLVHGDLHPNLHAMEEYKTKGLKGGRDEPIALFTHDRELVPGLAFDSKFEKP